MLIVSLASGDDERDNAQGLRLGHFPNSLLQEVKNLEAGGSKVMLIVAGCPPGYAKINLVDPALIPVAIKYGSDRGVSDAPKLGSSGRSRDVQRVTGVRFYGRSD